MGYKINTQNTGLETDSQARRMVELMTADGHEVEFTASLGDVQACDENGDPIACPVSDSAWMSYLERAAAE